MAAGRAAAAELWATPGAADVASVANAVTVAVVRTLEDAGCLAEPKATEPGLEDAAKLLCALSQSVKLNDPEEDFHQLLEREDMVTYALRQAQAAGLDPREQSEALAARRVLLAHHQKSRRGVVG